VEQKYIKELKPGDRVTAFFILRKKELRTKKASKDKYLALEFGDRTGRIQGTLWDNVVDVYSKIRVGDVVKIDGEVRLYQNRQHIIIDKVRKVRSDEKVDPARFLPRTPHRGEEQLKRLKEILNIISEPKLKELIGSFFQDEKFLKEFSRAPGGKLWHHAYLGGLLDHTLAVVRNANFLATNYPTINRDILLTSAFLHDIGKIDEFSLRGFVNYSTPGRLIGHVNLGFKLVLERISEIEDFPKAIKLQLLHCILSHHGEKEKGSPIEPMTIEALVLYYADELDAQINAFQRIISDEKEPGKEWSNYVNLIDRFIYLGRDD